MRNPLRTPRLTPPDVRGWLPAARERVAVVINNRFWPGTVTDQVRDQAREVRVRVLADNGVHRWFDVGHVWNQVYARDFIAGRILGMEGQAAGLRAIGQAARALEFSRAAAVLDADLLALRRG